MTLLEVLIATTITALIAVVIVAFSIIYFRVWMKNSARSQASPAAYDALSRITNDIRTAAYINAPAAGDTDQAWIIIYPAHMVADTSTYANGAMRNAVPLMPKMDAVVNGTKYIGVRRYYISDVNGISVYSVSYINLQANQNTVFYLWMQIFDENMVTGAVTTTSRQRIAKGIKGLNLFYGGKDSSQIYGIESVVLGVQGKEKSYTYLSAFSSKISVRNKLPASISIIDPVF